MVASLGPVITFEVEDAVWVTGEPSEGLVAVVRAVAPGSQGTITLRFARPIALHAGPDAVHEPTTAADAVATLRDNPSLIHLGSSPGLTGGVPASVIEIEGVGAETWPVLQTAGSTLELVDGRRMWISFSDWPDGLLAIVVEGAAADWDRDLRIVEPVLESVALGR